MRTIREHKCNCDKADQVFECELLSADAGQVVLRYVTEQEYAVAGELMPAGSSTLGLYRAGSRHVFWKMLRPDGLLHGFLIHVCDPIQVDPGSVTYRDLMLDVWQEPGQAPVLLDEEELAAAVRAGQVDPAKAEEARATARDLLSALPAIAADAESILAPFHTRQPTGLSTFDDG